MVDITSIRNTLSASVIQLRTLDWMKVDIDSMSYGNNAVTARCKLPDREGWYLVKCYFRPKHHLAAIYGDSYLPKELGVYTIQGNIEYIDIVLLPWVEGHPLDSIIGSDNADYASLSRSFDRLARTLLDSDGAHGDIKPENIIVTADGQMVTIDHDASWSSKLNGTTTEEIGTPIYCHPRNYDIGRHRSADDFPIALISIALAALSIDREAMHGYIKEDKSLFDPAAVVSGTNVAMNRAIEIFSQSGDAAHYRIASALKGCYPTIYGLGDWLRFVESPPVTEIPLAAEIEALHTYWGYRMDDRWVVPPLYDDCISQGDNKVMLILGEQSRIVPRR